ncbi:restriction endonuclease subunit S [Vibrio furnissii]|uniref:restriction endonuclease subunit S n=1 Tax=Vibrio furnissii TaxID=29494 RepID=UPI001EEC2DC4|nr:restriction endonuclease subunit S [Vibrio furnissii]MCG6216100.1 restriction endonuclease subunit S [Vibrio furnissii]
MIFNSSKYNTEWNTKRLSDLGKFQRGKSRHRPRNDSKLFEHGTYPLVQTGEVKAANLYIRTHEACYNDFGLSQSAIWPENTLCITIAANIAETALLGYPMCFPDSVVGFNAYPEESSELFMHYVFTYIRKAIQNSASGSIQDNINIEYLTGLQFKIPHKTYQDKIAEILSSLDNKIELNNRINSELEAMAKTLYEYWFVQFDFPDENGKPYKASGGRMVFDSELNREIPMGWTTKSLGEIVDIVKGNVSPKEVSSSTPYIGLEHIQRKNLALIDWASSDIAASNKTIFKEGDILFGKIRPYFHKVTVAPFDGITSTDTLVFRPKSHKLYGLVLEVIFSGEFVEIASQSSTGSKMPRADWNVLKNYPVVIPQDDLLEKFQGLIDKYCKKLKSITIENHELRNLRDWLLPMLMNGQVTVKPSTESKEAQHG